MFTISPPWALQFQAVGATATLKGWLLSPDNLRRDRSSFSGTVTNSENKSLQTIYGANFPLGAPGGILVVSGGTVRWGLGAKPDGTVPDGTQGNPDYRLGANDPVLEIGTYRIGCLASNGVLELDSLASFRDSLLDSLAALQAIEDGFTPVMLTATGSVMAGTQITCGGVYIANGSSFTLQLRTGGSGGTTFLGPTSAITGQHFIDFGGKALKVNDLHATIGGTGNATFLVK